jgi:DNA-binding response OmpR family regulator
MTRRCLLVIDDDKALRRLLFRALTKRGFRVRTAADGLKGVAAARRRGPDAVLTDVEMPGLDGLQVLEILRRERPAAVVIVATGRPSQDGARRAAELGAFAYIGKPFRLPELIALLDEALAAAGRADDDGDAGRN